MFAQNLRLVSLVVAVLVVGDATTARAGFTQVGFSLFNGSSVNFNSRSASLADYDNDGDLDLFFQGATGSQKLYRNSLTQTGSLAFTDATPFLPGGLTSSWSAAWADYDGDGLVDVFIGSTNSSPTTGTVLKNGGLFFANQSAATGLNDPGFHQNVAWADIDNDNDLDLLLAMEGPTEKHEIYLQGPGQQFTPVGASVGFQEDFGTKAYGMALGDTDNDGDVDVYISTCRFGGNIRNNFYENQLVETGSLGFVDIAGADSSNTDGNGTQFLENSYGAEFIDFDDDGYLDLFMVGADQEPSKIFRNLGNNQFVDVETITGSPLLSNVGGDLNGARAVDYDNDGDLDLFFHDHKTNPGANTARKLFRNDGNWDFTDVTAEMGIETVNMGSYDSPWGDIDNDGDMDLIATTDSAWLERVFLNDASTNGNHWLQVVLEGESHNTTGLGASIFATINEGTAEERTIRREANTNAGTFNQSDLPVHFGLGDAGMIDELLIRWADGTIQVLTDVTVDQFLTVSQSDALLGDYNGDGVVDAADYTRYRDGLGPIFREADRDVWAANVGSVAASVSESVPEPTAAGMLVAAALTAVIRARRGRGATRPAAANA